MKILFWIDLFTLPFGIAHYIQKKIDCELFAIIDTFDNAKPFFVEQKLTNFSKTWFYGNKKFQNSSKIDLNFLSITESKYQLEFWSDLINDRYFNEFNRFHKFSSNEILSILNNDVVFFDKILDEVKPDFIFMIQPPMRSNNLFLEMCKSRGIKRIILNPSIIGKECFFSQDVNKIDTKILNKNIFLKNLTFTQLLDSIKQKSLSLQIRNYSKKMESNSIEKFHAFLDYMSSSNDVIKNDYRYFGRNKMRVLLDELFWRTKTKIRKQFIDKNLLKMIPNFPNLVYYPLHVEPDRNILLGAPFFTNQIENIRQIAKSIPINFKLIVKEHPAQSKTWRKSSYYKEIMKIPNVYLIHPDVPNNEIFEKINLVITAAGSSGFEILFYGKPSIVFSDTLYDEINYVYKNSDMSKLRNVIQDALKINPDPIDLEKFLNKLNLVSFELDFFEFFIIQAKYFFHGANFQNTSISEEKMKNFLLQEKEIFDNCSNECIKFINQISNED